MTWRTIAPAAAVLATLAAGGCSDSGSMIEGGSTGRVQLVLGGSATQSATLGSTAALSDDRGRTIEAAVITLSSVLARNLDGELVDVSVSLPMEVDLIDLILGRTVELPIGALPVDSYDQLVVVIRSLGVVLSDGTRIDVTPPGGGWTAIVRTEPFDVAEGTLTTVNLRFRADRAFRWVEDRLEFHPEFDADVDDGDDDDHDDDDD